MTRLDGAGSHRRDQPPQRRSNPPTTPSTASKTPESVKRGIKDILDSPYEKGDRVTISAGVSEDARPFVGHNFQATLRDLETKMREAAANLEFEVAARLRDEIKRLKLLDLEFANEVGPPPRAEDGGSGRGGYPERAKARADAQERFRKGRL